MRDRLAEIHKLESEQEQKERLKRESHAEYMREWRQKQKEREKSELEQLIDAYNYPLNKENPDECILFRLLVLGYKSIKEYPFLKNNHLNKSLKGRIHCSTCKPYCLCWEWYKANKPIEGVRIW